MAPKSKARNEGAKEMHEQMKDAAQHARQSYAQAARAGQRMQEQASLWWRAVMGTLDWQKQAETFLQVARHAVPLGQRNAEHLMEFIEKSSRTGSELMKQAAEAAQAPWNGEGQTAWLQLWTSTTKAAQAQTENLLEMSTRAIDSWAECVHATTETASVAA